MPINASILLATGLTDHNLQFIIESDGSFCRQVTRTREGVAYQILIYRANLTVMPTRCPHCMTSLTDNVYKCGTDTGEFTLPTTNGYSSILELTKSRYQCLTCRRTCHSISSDFIENTKITRPMAWQIFDLSRLDVSEKTIAYILKLSHSKIHRILQKASEQYQPDYTKPLPEVLSVDEVRYKKNALGFEMIDGATSEFIEIFPNRKNKDLCHYFSQYSLENRRRVKTIITDMNANYQTPLRTFFPNAEIIIDHFHIVKLAKEAVRTARISAQNACTDKKSRQYKLLKSNWRFFETASDKISDIHARYFAGLNEYMYPEDARKMAFAQFPDLEVTYNFYQAVIKSLNHRCFDTIEAILTDCTKTNTPIDSVMKTFRKFQKALKLGFESEHSNGRLEGTNRRIKQIGRTAYGYTNPKNYFFRIRLQLSNRNTLDSQYLNWIINPNKKTQNH